MDYHHYIDCSKFSKIGHYGNRSKSNSSKFSKAGITAIAVKIAVKLGSEISKVGDLQSMEKTNQATKTMAGLMALFFVSLVSTTGFVHAVNTTNKLSFDTYNTGGLLDLRVGDSAILPNNIKVVYEEAIDEGSGQVKAKFELYDLNGNNIGEVTIGKNELVNAVAANIQVKDIPVNAVPGLIKVDINTLCTPQYPCDAVATAIAGIATGSGYTATPAVLPTPIVPTRTVKTEAVDSDFPMLPSDSDEVGGVFSYTNTLYPGWNLFSTPYDNAREYFTPEGTNAIVLEGPEFSATTCSDSTKVYWYNAKEKKYVKIGSIADFKSKQSAFSPGGTAYWMKASETCTIQTRGNHPVAFNAPSYIPLEAGWTSFGSPAQPTAFEKVKNNCVVKSGPWKYNTLARKYEKASILQPGEGYFVKTTNQCTLAFSAQLVEKPVNSNGEITETRTSKVTKMYIGDKITLSNNYKLELVDIAGFAIGPPNAVPAHFIIYDATGKEIDRTQVVAENPGIYDFGKTYNKNGVSFEIIGIKSDGKGGTYAELIINPLKLTQPTAIPPLQTIASTTAVSSSSATRK